MKNHINSFRNIKWYQQNTLKHNTEQYNRKLEYISLIINKAFLKKDRANFENSNIMTPYGSQFSDGIN